MKRVSRILAMAMAVILAISLLGVTAYADGAPYEPTDTYVLNYNGAYDGPKWQYFSPYIPAWTYDGQSDSNNTISFTLYDTGSSDRFATYCTDVAVGLASDSDFRRINLEDSTYAGAAAGQLRSVFLKGFPHTRLEDLAAAAGVEGLTVGEAVTATQLAIWHTAHSGQMEITDFCHLFDTQWNSNGVTANFEDCYAEIGNGYASAENEALIEDHIKDVYAYLINLEPTAPSGAVASESSFLAWDAELLPNEDGSYDVLATATVDAALDEGDSLTLTAVVGEYSACVPIEDGARDYTLTITDVPADVAVGAVTLAIDGIQSLGDVYLFDAEGQRGSSQSLIGYTANPLPVHAQVNANDRILHIFKSDDGVGLQNITFDIYYVCSVDEYVNGTVVIGTGVHEIDGVSYFSAPTAEDISRYTASLPFATITTDAAGTASFNFGNENDGIYMVTERENPVTTGAIAPFFVAIPGGSCAAATDVYEILVQPKNDVIEEDVIIEKDINEIGSDHATEDVGRVHTWIIRSSIPAGLATGLRYEITDTLNYQLTYAGNLRAAVAERNAAAGDDLLELTEGTDYTLTVTETGEGEAQTTALKLTLTRTGMENAAAVVGDEPEIRVYLDAYIDADAILGSEIPNQAHIRYENHVGVDFDRDSDIPEVHTGGISLVKVDASNQSRRLAGAEFTLNVKNEDGSFTPVEFYADAALTRRVSRVVTDANGEALFFGLAYGTYYLIETEAPEGYNPLTEPVEVLIHETTHLEGNAVLVTNSAQFRLPETGGAGTALFTLGGAGLIGGAALLLLGGRKKRG